jgi:sarcosine oxidase, subunit beta
MPLPARAEAVVVGGGVMGASIAHHLALRGVDVLLLERGALCSGPTRHSTAIVRLHYTQPLLVRMALHGLRAYTTFAGVLGAPSGFVRTGMLFAADERERDLLAGNVEIGRAEGVTTRLLSAAEVSEVDGRIATDGLAFCYEPEAGYCDPYLVTTGYVAAARRSGATVAEGVTALGLSDGRVRTTTGDVDAGAVVVAAGVWTRALLEPLGYDLPVTAAPAEVGRFRLPDGFGPAPPAVADFSGPQVYFRPAEPGYLEVGSLDPAHSARPVDPDRPPEGAERASLESYRSALATRLPGSDRGHWRGGWTGVYDVTPDWEPVLGLVPGSERTYVAAGFSGHGFKLAPAVGLALADLVVDGRAETFDLSLLAPDRFERGELVGARYGYSVLG